VSTCGSGVYKSKQIFTEQALDSIVSAVLTADGEWTDTIDITF